ncbi:MAG: hypothetical protein AAF193_03685, partial [Bacteroidota bacterium]
MNASSLLHDLVQYLAGVTIALVPRKDDDSHTSLEWSPELSSFITHPLNQQGLVLGLDAIDLRLWFNQDDLEFDLIGARHGEVLNWIQQHLSSLGLSCNQTFSFHYSHPSHDWSDMHLLVEMTEEP